MEIQPGGLLHGDENGVVNVPMDIAEPMVEEVRKVRETEAKLFEYLGSPSVTLEGLKATSAVPPTLEAAEWSDWTRCKHTGSRLQPGLITRTISPG